ncbi:MAG TPA: hypothetical protein VD905_06775 [Flavobacteriales bacterium]|nr:hypothetical protein [Flavobacteriales bacterium]
MEKINMNNTSLFNRINGQATKWLTMVIMVFVVSKKTFAAGDTLRKKQTVSVLSLDTKGVDLDPVQAGNLVRLELEKLDVYEVMDRYDVTYLIEKNKLQINNCYGKICLVEIGSTIKSEKMLTGTIELIGNNIIYSLRLVDVKSQMIEKSAVHEFLNLPAELQAMTTITMRELFGFEIDPLLSERLTKKNNYEGAQNNPNQTRLNLNGPRMGLTVLTGEQASLFGRKAEEGGYDGYPVMFQFGYQFEMQYLNEGNFQALFEFIPMLSGMDQGRVIPSLAILNGFRDNRHGWEFAFGPVIYPVKRAQGFYDAEGNWELLSDHRNDTAMTSFPIVKRLDSRGEFEITSGFVFGFGRTFKSGKLNIPVNGYIIPGRYGWRYGFSFGFNVKKTPKEPETDWKSARW